MVSAIAPGFPLALLREYKIVKKLILNDAEEINFVLRTTGQEVENDKFNNQKNFVFVKKFSACKLKDFRN